MGVGVGGQYSSGPFPMLDAIVCCHAPPQVFLPRVMNHLKSFCWETSWSTTGPWRSVQEWWLPTEEGTTWPGNIQRREVTKPENQTLSELDSQQIITPVPNISSDYVLFSLIDLNGQGNLPITFSQPGFGMQLYGQGRGNMMTKDWVLQQCQNYWTISLISHPSSHAEDHPEQIEATSGEDCRWRTGRLQSREHHRSDLQPTNPPWEISSAPARPLPVSYTHLTLPTIRRV